MAALWGTSSEKSAILNGILWIANFFQNGMLAQENLWRALSKSNGSGTVAEKTKNPNATVRIVLVLEK
ncbi:MAG: hypothetical protein ACI4QH_01900 [Candidatus Fimimonas sp.]